MVEGIFTIKNRLGLHARASAIFVKKAAEYRSEVWMEKDGARVNGKSIMGLLTLGGHFGSKIFLRVEGEDENDAFAGLRKLLEEGFGEK